MSEPTHQIAEILSHVHKINKIVAELRKPEHKPPDRWLSLDNAEKLLNGFETAMHEVLKTYEQAIENNSEKTLDNG